MFIDTHCHLDASEFEDAETNVITNAQAAGVDRLVVPSVSIDSLEIVRELCIQFPCCFPAYGFHPMYVGDAIPADLDVLRDYLKQHQPIAVGEIGLDFFIPHYDQARQEHFFIEQLKLAREFNLPVLLHLRRAQDTVLKYLRQHKVCGGIAHAFNGSHQQAEEFIKLGFKLGFGGAMTYPRATKLRELAATLPLECIVLETDSPDIPPAFLEKGLPNEPQYMPGIAQVLADLRGMSLEVVARVTTENARSVLLGLK
jgi:TatD DNase family protein